MKIAVSIGHTLSGADTGAVGYLNESKCTREIGELVKNKLEAQGHNVVYCRIDNASSVNSSLSYRVNKANASNVDLFIEIHLNAGGGTGAETWVCGTGGTAEKYARNIVNSICELGYANRGVKVGNLYVTRNTVAPAVLIECCFVDSKSDSTRYNEDKMASKIVKGITGIEGGSSKVEDKINFDAVAMNQCSIELTDSEGSGRLDPLELCEIIGVDNNTFQRTVRYKGWDRTKEGRVVTGDVNLIKDAYNYYNASTDTIKGYKDKDLKEEIGNIYSLEKVCVGEIKDNIAYVRFDSAAAGPLMHCGYCKAETLLRIGEEPPKEETPIEPVKPTPEPQKNYKVTITCKDQAEANFIKGFLSTAKVEEY